MGHSLWIRKISFETWWVPLILASLLVSDSLQGYTIVPIASVGMDDIVEIVVDAPVGFILKHVFGDPRSDLTWPIVRPASFQTQYFYFCEEIHTKDLQFNETNVQVLRESAYNSLTTGINKMLQKRETDPDRYPISFTRLISKLKGN